jgi:predicted MPP superfamily phosphohydrolase
MKKIVHLSDLHIGHEDCGARFRTIIKNIKSRAMPADNYIIVITGDIVDNAAHPEQAIEAADLIGQLKEQGYIVLAIPGNHDYGNGSWGDRKYVKEFKKIYYNDPYISYPKLDIIDEMAFIGLDSMAEELHWYDRIFSEGELGKKQLKRLRGILEKPEIVKTKKIVYFHHHPIDFKLAMQLKDKKQLKNIIENRVDALLFGHYHSHSASAEKDFNGTWGIPRCYNAGSSTHKNENYGFHRIIDLSNEDTGSDYDGNFL